MASFIRSGNDLLNALFRARSSVYLYSNPMRHGSKKTAEISPMLATKAHSRFGTRRIALTVAKIAFAGIASAQNFVNGDLEGTINISAEPPFWQNVPFTDMNCQANAFGWDTPDITGISGPGLSAGIIGTPYSGSTFESGMYGGNTKTFFQEGIMQTVSGFEIGQNYSIDFYQSVVKQDNALDPSGSWAVYIDSTLAGITTPTFSVADFNSISFIWEFEQIEFMATSTSHLIKFLPVDDDSNTIFSITDINGALRMGIDNISLSFHTGIKNEPDINFVSIYPNPFDKLTTLKFNNINKHNCTLTLCDPWGQLVRTEKNITTDTVEIERQNLERGFYFFRLCSGEQIIANGKLMIN